VSTPFDPHRHGVPTEVPVLEEVPPGVEQSERESDDRSLVQRVKVPVLLFLATCLTTTLFGNGPLYAAALLFTLVCHEFGHYLQARRYRVPASLPYFIPVPLAPLGTMGAVINMRGNIPHRKALFDIGISGPLAGLVPAIVFTIVGLMNSWVVQTRPGYPGNLGEPLLFKGIAYLIFGALPDNQTILLHPVAFAGWVAVLITSVNLFPIGQLDGGHILYGILREKAHIVAYLLLSAAIAAVVLAGAYQWMLMLMLLTFIGPKHPPTAHDDIPLGLPRVILGWLTLAFVVVGFTPQPFL
jgi:membrane-associated protease RseP (regulator of RpoE activity)